MVKQCDSTNCPTDILLFGYFGFGNWGDELMLTAFLEHVRQLGAGDIVAISGAPEHTRKLHNVRAIGRFNIPAMLREFKLADCAIGCGGSLLQDATSLRSLLYYIMLIMLAHHFDAKVLLIAQGIGPVKRRISRWLARYALRTCDLITLRDEQSYRIAIELGASESNTHVTADLAFLLAPPFQCAPPDDDMTIGVALRQWRLHSRVVPEVATALSNIGSRMGVKQVRCISFHPAVDEPIHQALMERLKGMVVEICRPQSLHQLWRCVEGVHVLICARLHAVILGLLTGIPTIALRYDPKVSAIMHAWEPQLCLDWNNVTAEMITKCVHRCVNEWEHLHATALSLAHRAHLAAVKNIILLSQHWKC